MFLSLSSLFISPFLSIGNFLKKKKERKKDRKKEEQKGRKKEAPGETVPAGGGM